MLTRRVATATTDFSWTLLDITVYRLSCVRPIARKPGKVERFHRYLRESFFAPIQTGQSDLVDVATANREVRIWLNETANVRLHATLKERPFDRFAIERERLRALPLPYAGKRLIATHNNSLTVPMPIESLQHPLAIYDKLAREIAT